MGGFCDSMMKTSNNRTSKEQHPDACKSNVLKYSILKKMKKQKEKESKKKCNRMKNSRGAKEAST
jgi:hypothetical protein